MASSEFRFGVNLLSVHEKDAWLAKCRRAEALGYDVVLVPDHLGMPAPFPYLVAAAAATERVRVGTFVLNAAFYNPTVLARDVLGTATVTGGRLELGLGTGYVREEFDATGIEFGTPGSRIEHLERTVTRVREVLAENGASVPMLLGGNGNRMLRMAAEHADTIGFTGAASDRNGKLTLINADALAERVDVAKAAAGSRNVELNLLVQEVRPGSDAAELRDRFSVEFTAEEFDAVPTVLYGEPAEIAGQLRAHRDGYGISYYTVLESSMDYFAEVIPHLR